jgi:hypothetical protein
MPRRIIQHEVWADVVDPQHVTKPHVPLGREDRELLALVDDLLRELRDKVKGVAREAENRP